MEGGNPGIGIKSFVLFHRFGFFFFFCESVHPSFLHSALCSMDLYFCRVMMSIHVRYVRMGVVD